MKTSFDGTFEADFTCSDSGNGMSTTITPKLAKELIAEFCDESKTIVYERDADTKPYSWKRHFEII